MRRFCRPTTRVLPYDARAAEVHGAERARLERLGRAPTFADGQLAGVAIANALVLVTANAKDFTRFDGLVVENWLAIRQEPFRNSLTSTRTPRAP